MTIHEIAKVLNITKRAIKYYEEQGLLKVEKDNNGYRNYSEEDLETLRKISVYRKLGIGISDIKSLLEDEKREILLEILDSKEKELQDKTAEYEKLKEFVRSGNASNLAETISYESIGQAIADAVPGFYGYYFLHHFMPFLQGNIETLEQKEAYKKVCKTHSQLPCPSFMRGRVFLLFPFSVK